MQIQYTISSEQDMIALGRSLLASGYKKFGLRGELGAGKTHFTKWVALGLWLDPDLVHSPTYVYFHEYNAPMPRCHDATMLEQSTAAPQHCSTVALLHVDMYRITDPFQIVKMWLEDKLSDYEYRAIEWPREDFITQYEELVMVDIEIVDQYNRVVTVTSI